ncbi:MAG: tetratricopeptide repeat protein [Anaerolineae bacterium]|nr:MAG: tetratricopeptide repeat protein [Anaerolineae bacterium]
MPAAICWQEVLTLVRRTGIALEARALSNLGAAYQYLGLFDEARAFLEQGLALCALTGDRHGRAYILVNLGGVSMLSGDLRSARRLIEQGLSEANDLDDASLRAGGLWELGRLDLCWAPRHGQGVFGGGASHLSRSCADGA